MFSVWRLPVVGGFMKCIYKSPRDVYERLLISLIFVHLHHLNQLTYVRTPSIDPYCSGLI